MKGHLISEKTIEHKIYLLRGQKAMLDKDLAELYGVKPIALRQQVKRNMDRFPSDFIFQLSREEAAALVSQNVIPSFRSLGGALPYAFTEQGIAMLSSVLRSKQAVYVNIAIMRAFVRLREFLATHKELAAKLGELETKVGKHDQEIKLIFEAIRQLIAKPSEAPKRKIGFHAD